MTKRASRGETSPQTESRQNGEHRNIARAAAILDVLSVAGNAGMRLTDVMNATGLKKTVVHRALLGLAAHGMAFFDKHASRFYLGDGLFAWVKRAGDRFTLADRIEPHVRVLADDLGDNSYFLVRRGDNALCLNLAEGSFPIKSLTLGVGDTRPLGAGSGPLAILACLPDEEVGQILAATADRRRQYDLDDARVLRSVADARERQFSIHEGLSFKMMTGVAVPVRNPSGRCVAAFTTVAIASRLEPPRLESVIARMRAEVEVVEKSLAPLLAEL